MVTFLCDQVATQLPSVSIADKSTISRENGDAPDAARLPSLVPSGAFLRTGDALLSGRRRELAPINSEQQ